MKEKHIRGYNFFRGIITALLKLFYKMETIGKENIPSDGPVVVCCNHTHAHDQFPLMMSTKRMVHYMAKKEYFDSKMGWFFRSVGCIPVDRSIHDDNAKSEALDVLKNGGIFGIFPEGTRNQLSCKKERIDELYKLYDKDMSKKEFIKIIKNNRVRISQIDYLKKLLDDKKIDEKLYKEYLLNPNKYLKEMVHDKIISESDYDESLLLPFKFGAVSMASKTDAYILPFASNGEYKIFGKKPKTIIGKPFKVHDGNLEEANNRLRKEIIGLLKSVME